MEDPLYLEQIKYFISQGVLGAIVAFMILVVWKKVIPWLERYLVSVEKLHDSIGDNMGKQQALCHDHGTTIHSHDKQMRKAAIEACAMCRAIAEKDLPGSAALVGKHCDEIERIIGEA